MSTTCDITVSEAEKPRTYPYIGRWKPGHDMLFLGPLFWPPADAPCRRPSTAPRAIFASDWLVLGKLAGEVSGSESGELVDYQPVKAIHVIENRTDREYPRIYSANSEGFFLAVSAEVQFQITSATACFRTSRVCLGYFEALPAGSKMTFICDPDAETPCRIEVEVAEITPPAPPVPKRITNIRDLHEGMRVCGVIDGCEFEDGMIRFDPKEPSIFFICQDAACGHRIDAKFRYGYDHSWAVHFNTLGAILFAYDSDANEDLELYAADCANDAD